MSRAVDTVTRELDYLGAAPEARLVEALAQTLAQDERPSAAIAGLSREGAAYSVLLVLTERRVIRVAVPTEGGSDGPPMVATTSVAWPDVASVTYSLTDRWFRADGQHADSGQVWAYFVGDRYAPSMEALRHFAESAHARFDPTRRAAHVHASANGENGRGHLIHRHPTNHWEYLVLTRNGPSWNASDGQSLPDGQGEATVLNAMGTDGWELVTALEPSPTAARYLFKRLNRAD